MHCTDGTLLASYLTLLKIPMTMSVTTLFNSPLRFCTQFDISPVTKRFAPMRNSSPALERLDSCIIPHQADPVTCSISQKYEALVAHLQTIETKADTVSERYLLYEPVLQVYSAVCLGKVPPSVHFEIKQRVYQMVFDVLHRKLLIDFFALKTR